MPRFELLITYMLLKLSENGVVSGFVHPAEHTVLALLKYYPKEYADYLNNLLDDENYSFILADILICVGYNCNESWTDELFRKALTLNNVEIRDAAIQMLDEHKRYDILELHVEEVPWLHTYLENVLKKGIG